LHRRWLVLIGSSALFLAGLACGGVADYFVGWAAGEGNFFHKTFLRQKEKIDPVLKSSPDYSGIEIHEESLGGAFLEGRVASKEIHQRLHEEMRKLFGEGQSKHLMVGVSVSRE
jgi:hypothetical protein